jgi:Tfp pilus assembly pilus retraction ATPase PilT
MTYSVSDLMQLAVAEGALGVHLHDGKPPVLEFPDLLMSVEGPRMEPDAALALLRTIAPPEELEELTRNGHALFRHRFSEAVVFRVLAFRENGSVRLELRRLTEYEDAA